MFMHGGERLQGGMRDSSLWCLAEYRNVYRRFCFCEAVIFIVPYNGRNVHLGYIIPEAKEHHRRASPRSEREAGPGSSWLVAEFLAGILGHIELFRLWAVAKQAGCVTAMGVGDSISFAVC